MVSPNVMSGAMNGEHVVEYLVSYNYKMSSMFVGLYFPPNITQ